MTTQNNNLVIKCRLGCINYYVKQIGDCCMGDGLFPQPVHEGINCIRGYTKQEMDKILEKERLEDEVLRQKEASRMGLYLSLV